MIKSAAIELTDFISKLNIGKSMIRFGKQEHPIGSKPKVDILKNIVYSEWYSLKRRYQLAAREEAFLQNEDNEKFQNELKKNNQTLSRDEEGWEISKDLGNGYLEITKFQKKEIVAKSAIKPQEQNYFSNQTKEVTVHFTNGKSNLQPNFYYVFGKQRLNTAENLTRIYWNINSDGAPKLVNIITTTLNHYHLPFLFKCLNKPNLYYRRDPAVLYLESQNLAFLGNLMPEIYECIKEFLDEDTPLFSYEYQPGIGIAESPNIGESFGLNRAEIVAKVLANSNASSTENLISQIDQAFTKNNLQPEAPYLKAGIKKLTL